MDCNSVSGGALATLCYTILTRMMGFMALS